MGEKLRIQVDARCLQDDGYRYRGIGQHSASLLRRAAVELASAGGVELIGLLDRRSQSLAPEHADLFDALQYSPAPDKDAEWFISLSPMTHSPLPLARVFLNGPSKLAAVVYDFIPIEHPDRYLTGAPQRQAYLTCLRWLGYYQRLACISQFTADGCRQHVKSQKGERYVTGVAVRPSLLEQARSPGAEGKHFVVVAGGDSRKNAECAVAAHARSSVARARALPLIIVGGYEKTQHDALRELYAREGGEPDLLEFRSGLSDAALASLYADAVLTICPSRSEGFSIPVVEANANSSPVIVADCAAQTELIPFAEDQFAPDDHARVTALIDEAVVSPAARAERMKRQKDIWAKFDEESVGRRFWAPFVEDAAQRTPRGPSAPSVRRGAKPRIAFVSPLPPAQSGVADYAGCCIESLVKMAEVHVYSDTAAPTPSGAHSVRPVSPLPYLSGRFDAVVSAIGNSHFHMSALDMLLDHGGAAVVHDSRMINFYSILLGPERATALAARELGRNVTWPEVERWLHHQRHLPTLFLSEILEAAAPTIVHSRGTKELIRRIYNKDVRYLPFAPQRIPSDDLCTPWAKAEMRRTLGIAEDAFLISTFGGVIPDKAPDECLWTLDRLVAWGINAHLAFVGGAARPIAEHLRRLATLLNLSDRVHIFEGYLGEGTYSSFLTASDMAMQLRTHGLGSVSGALMDCITSGLPAIANLDLAEALDAPDYVLRTKDAISPVLIAEEIAAAYEAGVARARPMDQRRAFLDERNFDRYNAAMLETLGVG